MFEDYKLSNISYGNKSDELYRRKRFKKLCKTCLNCKSDRLFSRFESKKKTLYIIGLINNAIRITFHENQRRFYVLHHRHVSHRNRLLEFLRIQIHLLYNLGL